MTKPLKNPKPSPWRNEPHCQTKRAALSFARNRLKGKTR